jgi:hypothetical protein
MIGRLFGRFLDVIGRFSHKSIGHPAHLVVMDGFPYMDYYRKTAAYELVILRVSCKKVFIEIFFRHQM